MKLNNKGMTIIEIVLTFVLIMVIVVGMFTIIMNYRGKISDSYTLLELDTLKNTLTRDIQKDIITLGIKEINDGGECQSIEGLNSCINIVFKDNTEKAFGTSKIDVSDKNTIINKFLYYDGEKYKIHDSLPDNIPSGRDILDFQTVVLNDENILSSDSIVLEDGTMVNFYNIDVSISHVDFDKDFGIHIVATSEDISL